MKKTNKIIGEMEEIIVSLENEVAKCQKNLRILEIYGNCFFEFVKSKDLEQEYTEFAEKYTNKSGDK